MDEDDDYLDWSDDEEDIICTSKYISSDEDDISIPIKPTSRNAGTSKKAPDDQDDFEKEMASELSMTVQHLAASFAIKKPQHSSGSSTLSIKEEKNTDGGDAKFYDEVYFDSDDSEAEGTEAASRRVMSNDELLYDPTLDDKDQAWVDNKRRSYQPKQKRGMKCETRTQGGKASSGSSLPHSDAVLNCPACLTTLCMDCQRHEIYHNQYRAMFVFNCSVDKTESLRFPSKSQKKKEYFRNRKKKKLLHGDTGSGQDSKQDQFSNQVPVSGDNASTEIGQPEEASEGIPINTASPTVTAPEASSYTEGESDELYYSVSCKICNTKVAVYDKDEVYHFFNVVTSY